jgi:hypothetical protein
MMTGFPRFTSGIKKIKKGAASIAAQTRREDSRPACQSRPVKEVATPLNYNFRGTLCLL